MIVAPESTDDLTSPETLFVREGTLGRIILNRPRAMNALTHGMVTTIGAQLTEWEIDASVETVLIQGAGDRGLCAGGDIVSLYSDITGSGNGASRFWADEYALNLQISTYSKPYVAIMDGVVLGGGVGVSVHGSVRVVTERTKIGMPEVGIGFVPDVGGTWLLARAPGELGKHVGLTGGTFSGADALELGFADHFVASGHLDQFVEALASMSISDALLRFESDPPHSDLAASRAWIDECYDSNDATEILARLSAADDEDARDSAAVIRTKSPLAVAVTLESIRRARIAQSLADVLNQEYRVSLRFASGEEMAEGIRAQVIDKDRQPRWSPTTLAQVRPETIDAYFAPLPRGELGLSLSTPHAQESGSRS
jgi:enoyl-CoA hydratase